MKKALALAAAVVAALTFPARADGIDRDTLLVDAPASAPKGTVRVLAGGGGAGVAAADPDDPDRASTGFGGSLNGSVAWTPVAGVTAIAGAKLDPAGPTEEARVKLQMLSQGTHGLDLATGLRVASTGFFALRPEAELSIAAGRRFGDFSLFANAVIGAELGGEVGTDAELKAAARYALFEDMLSLGVDGRSRWEVEGDAEEQAAEEAEREAGGRAFDVAAGPAVTWRPLPALAVDALVGVTLPLRQTLVAPLALLSVSYDF